MWAGLRGFSKAEAMGLAEQPSHRTNSHSVCCPQSTDKGNGCLNQCAEKEGVCKCTGKDHSKDNMGIHLFSLLTGICWLRTVLQAKKTQGQTTKWLRRVCGDQGHKLCGDPRQGVRWQWHGKEIASDSQGPGKDWLEMWHLSKLRGQGNKPKATEVRKTQMSTSQDRH